MALTSTSQYAKILPVRIISRKKIREASAIHPQWGASLASWYKIVKAAKWKHFPDVKQSWSNVDKVGTCVVFDICNNKCRLIAYVRYDYEKLFILHVLSHTEYDNEGWKNDCDCGD
jgi:mRNA interferase HigB